MSFHRGFTYCARTGRLHEFHGGAPLPALHCMHQGFGCHRPPHLLDVAADRFLLRSLARVVEGQARRVAQIDGDSRILRGSDLLPFLGILVSLFQCGGDGCLAVVGNRGQTPIFLLFLRNAKTPPRQNAIKVSISGSGTVLFVLTR